MCNCGYCAECVDRAPSNPTLEELTAKGVFPAMSDQLDIARLKELCAKATPGPWRPAEKHGMDTIWLDIDSDAGDELFNLEPRYIGHIGDQDHKQGQIDMRFVAAARTAVPALIADNERLEGELAEARREITRVRIALDQGEADRRRLDEVERRGLTIESRNGIGKSVDPWMVRESTSTHKALTCWTGKTAREAIDAATAEQEKRG